MNHRRPFVAFGATCLVSVSIFAVAGCGDYANPNAATGGSSGTATGGTGVTGGSAQGGSSGAAGSGPSGGATTGGAPTGGAAGSSSGGAAGGEPGGAGGMSGSGGGTSCTEAAPCGGDLTGTWTIQSCPLAVVGSVNVAGLGIDMQCTEGMITAGTLQITGSLTFNADMTFTDATTMTGNVTFELGPRCLILSGTTTTCDGLESPVGSVGFKSGSVMCTDNSTTMGCTCTGVIEQMRGFGYTSYDSGDNGTHMAMANEVALKWYGDPVDYSYCVAGSTLTMSLDSIPKTGTVDGPIVLQKQ